MGLFDYVADIGKSVFGIGDADAAEKIKADIEANNPGVSDLEVILDGENCTLRGNCESVEAARKVVLMAGNMKGVSSINGARLKVSQSIEAVEEAAPAEEEYYVIVSGDTLGGIAKKLLGSAGRYPEIFEANREVIEDPDKIFPGQKIRIPR